MEAVETPYCDLDNRQKGCQINFHICWLVYKLFIFAQHTVCDKFLRVALNIIHVGLQRTKYSLSWRKKSIRHIIIYNG